MLSVYGVSFTNIRGSPKIIFHLVWIKLPNFLPYSTHFISNELFCLLGKNNEQNIW